MCIMYVNGIEWDIGKVKDTENIHSRERERERESEREKERERVCVCVCVKDRGREKVGERERERVRERNFWISEKDTLFILIAQCARHGAHRVKLKKRTFFNQRGKKTHDHRTHTSMIKHSTSETLLSTFYHTTVLSVLFISSLLSPLL